MDEPEDNKLTLPIEKVSKAITLRLTASQHNAIKDRAEALDLSINRYILLRLFDFAGSEIYSDIRNDDLEWMKKSGK